MKTLIEMAAQHSTKEKIVTYQKMYRVGNAVETQTACNQSLHREH